MFESRGGGCGTHRLAPTRVYTNARISNLIPLCSACHSLVTEGYAEITRHGDEIVFDFGDGSRYVSYNHSLPVRNDSYVMPKAEKRGCADSFAS